MLKMYVLVRRDILPLVHAAVQASHSIAEFIYDHGVKNSVSDWILNHKTMIILSATEEEIKNVKILFNELGLLYKGFVEPDMSDIETAVTFEPIDNDLGKSIFSKLPLLK